MANSIEDFRTSTGPRSTRYFYTEDGKRDGQVTYQLKLKED